MQYSAREIIDKFVALRYKMGEVPTLVDFVSKTGVTPENIAECFCPGNAVDGYFIMVKECINRW